MQEEQCISYARSDQAWGGFRDYVDSWLGKSGGKNVLEVGGGANPMIPLETLRERGLRYSVLDIAQTELDKAPAGYNKICADISSPNLKLDEQFDFVFSQMLAEHVPDGEQFHRNIHALLSDGGVALHFFPTLYTLPFLANWLMPERLADWVLTRLAPHRDRFRHGKFPAYYSWCRGPTQAQLTRFRSLGYEVEEYRGFYGNGRYYIRLPLLKALHDWRVKRLLKRPNPIFTSFAFVVLRKPD